MQRRGAQASGNAAVAINGDNNGGVITNPTFITVTAMHADRSMRERVCLLPSKPSDFIGREAEIDALRRDSGSADGSLWPRLAIITGKPGVGKSTLAIHVAYESRNAYADGDLYADLRGVDDRPAEPEEIMGRFLRALGLPEQEIPADTHARLDTYRRMLADRPLVLVLDNVADEKQVRPLLPPGDSALVLITSRNRLPGLEGAHRTDLDVFPLAASLEFLCTIAGNTVVEADPVNAQDVVSSCGHLPLALRIAGNRLATTRNMRMVDLAAELRDQRVRLQLPETGDLAVRVAFNLSYRKLGKGAKNAFKRLSLVPAEDFGASLCSALLDCDTRQAARLLDKLYEANLIEPAAAFGRFRFHDLLKTYSRDKVQADPEKSRRVAQGRMLEWLKRSAVRSHLTLVGMTEAPGTGSPRGPVVTDTASALAWANAELPNAVAALPLLLEDKVADAAELALALSATCEIIGQWLHWDEVIRHGVTAAQAMGQPLLEIVFLNSKANLARSRREFIAGLELAHVAYARAVQIGDELVIASSANVLGCLLMDTGSLPEATPLLEQSLALFRRLDIRHEIAQGLYNLGTIHRMSGNTSEAIRLFEEDLRVCTEMGDESGAAETLNTLGLAYGEIGLHEEAEEFQRRSLAVFEKIGNPHKVSMVCNDLGLTLRHLNRAEESLVLHLRDIEISRQCGNTSGKALAQANAAETLYSLGRSEEAHSLFDSALATLTDLGDELRLARTLLARVPYYFDTGATSEAMAYAERAIALLTPRGEFRDVATAHQLISKHSGGTGDYEMSLRHARQGLHVGDAFTAPAVRAISLVQALVASEKLGHHDEARDYSEELRTLTTQHPGLLRTLSGASLNTSNTSSR
ncbi:tetratricopeptide repeat protein [Embleya sp. NBC_00888]|uniref:ATP-binding protein n=1 Tax=Embleya sp. NBC_00888 TaxID=2975960 RepID=UPI003866A055|nr:tetratricopeptide repeat protein [Embleya sp. NBC_00888]